MVKNCATCRHKCKTIVDEPCIDCNLVSTIVDGITPSKWEPAHTCSNCKHSNKKITEEPCLDCDIRVRNDKWEARE